MATKEITRYKFFSTGAVVNYQPVSGQTTIRSYGFRETPTQDSHSLALVRLTFTRDQLPEIIRQLQEVLVNTPEPEAN
jgi:hypothetical protein